MKKFSKEKTLTVGITTYFKTDIKDKIYEEAKKQGISQGELVRLAVQQYLEYLDLINESEDFSNLIKQDLIEE